MELIVELAQTKITTSDLIGLRVGDIIATEKDVHATAGRGRGGSAQVPRQSRPIQGPQSHRSRRTFGNQATRFTSRRDRAEIGQKLSRSK